MKVRTQRRIHLIEQDRKPFDNATHFVAERSNLFGDVSTRRLIAEIAQTGISSGLRLMWPPIGELAAEPLEERKR
jgi:hypothetical protein